VIDILDREVELILMPLQIAAILAAAVGQHPQQLTSWLSKNGRTRSLSKSAGVIGVLRSE
jgi:hypothetical protein